jgi:hypothetical protein
MPFRLLTVLMTFGLLLLGGCAAIITKSEPDQPEVIREGSTRVELIQRLGQPIESAKLAEPRKAVTLWESDHSVSLLRPNDTALEVSSFVFKGRRDRQARVAQAGFDSFMTLGLAELFLVPKALWERAVDEQLKLTVWFGSDGHALAFQWSALKP